MRILVTGGTGYLGSHTAVALIAAGHEPTLLDNFSNSKPAVLDRLTKITGQSIDFIEADITDTESMDALLKRRDFDSVIHFAAPKAVEESITDPLRYYEIGVSGTIALCRSLDNNGIRRIVFSSTAAVYGLAAHLPVTERSPIDILSPYGRTKIVGEQVLEDLYRSNNEWAVTVFRYFNAVGAHSSGLIGEDPDGTPTNLVPVLTEVATGRRPYLHIFGDDYDTPDGTGVRDFVHVMDLAEAHVAATERSIEQSGFLVMNLGTGRGVTVQQMVDSFSRAVNRPIPTQVSPRRSGDIPASYADASKAAAVLGWTATRSLDEMTADVWRWQSRNPNGYDE